MVETQEEFEINRQALSLGMCDLYSDLPVCEAGGFTNASLHRWPRLSLTEEVKNAISSTENVFNMLLMNTRNLPRGATQKPCPKKEAALATACFMSKRHVSAGHHEERQSILHLSRELETNEYLACTHTNFHALTRLLCQGRVCSTLADANKALVKKIKALPFINLNDELLSDVINMNNRFFSIDHKNHIGRFDPGDKKYTNMCPHIVGLLIKLAKKEVKYASDEDTYQFDLWRGQASIGSHRNQTNDDCLKTIYGFDVEDTFPDVIEGKWLLKDIRQIVYSYLKAPLSETLGRSGPRAHALRSLAKTDIDLFFTTKDPNVAFETIVTLYKRVRTYVPEITRHNITIHRSHNAITFVLPKPYRNIQLILRLYTGPAQVVTGFDIDCCAVCCVGGRPMASARGLRALQTRQNLVDPTRLSTTHESRQFKYMRRGFSVGVPDFKMPSSFLALPLSYDPYYLDNKRVNKTVALIPEQMRKVTGVRKLLMMLMTAAELIQRRASGITGHTMYTSLLGFNANATDYDSAHVPLRNTKDFDCAVTKIIHNPRWNDDVYPKYDVQKKSNKLPELGIIESEDIAPLLTNPPLKFEINMPFLQGLELRTGSFQPIESAWY
jgi:hypothetical protein